MLAGATLVARGRSDAKGRLIAADEPLAALQRACGGEIPGVVAIPALLELVRKAWRHRLKLARTIRAQDEGHAISAWVEVAPDAEGCGLAFSNWRAVPLGGQAETDDGDSDEKAAVAALLAELHVRLDPRQGVLAVGRAAGALESVAAEMGAQPGRPWTDFVAVVGNSHRQPLHWRLLDGAEVGVGEARWRARLIPQPGAGGGAEGSGFDLYLVPVALAALPDPEPADPPAEGLADALDGVLGRDLAPVLRQPINRIIANAETIRTRLAGPLAPEYATYAGDIAEAARHLLGLVEDIAELDAIESPGFAPVPERIDLADAARRSAGILAVRARERGIALELPGEDETMPAMGEFRRVLQVLLNLIGNALRYAPANSTVRLIAQRRGARSALTVADEGPGLDPEQQARVFAKFERLGRSGDGGSGLGLYISRRLAQAMGGDLTVASAPGEGVRFTLELPAAD